MAFDGDLTLASTSTLALDIAGTTPGTGHDQLRVAGRLGAAGTLRVDLASGYLPARGTCLKLLDFNAITGSFSSIVVPPSLLALDADATLLTITGELIIPEDLPDLAEPFGTLDFFDVLAFLRRTDAGDSKLGDVPPRDGTFTPDDVVRFLQLFPE